MSWKEAMLVRRGRLEALQEVYRLAGVHCATAPFRLEIERLIVDASESAPVPNSGSATSKAAARSMRVTAGSLRHRVLEAYKDGALTDEECAIRLGREHGVWPRCSELRLLKLIEWTGETRLIERSKLQGALSAITDAGRTMLSTLSANGKHEAP